MKKSFFLTTGEFPQGGILLVCILNRGEGSVAFTNSSEEGYYFKEELKLAKSRFEKFIAYPVQEERSFDSLFEAIENSSSNWTVEEYRIDEFLLGNLSSLPEELISSVLEALSGTELDFFRETF